MIITFRPTAKRDRKESHHVLCPGAWMPESTEHPDPGPIEVKDAGIPWRFHEPWYLAPEDRTPYEDRTLRFQLEYRRHVYGEEATR